MPLDYVPPSSVISLALIVPVAVALVNALAVWPGRRIGRLHPAAHLHTE